ncbi:hypothetical protein CERSUDRAFT_127329 [Gelatoporia subvermispora B]|uniref:Uncharacterized protein n=1 Tax=Ceriporiopsis subvermispora (strain B) TaxID=914234 RepID=M2Q494_CERS8|nr:hypothetical protein CERSUDRAFT_127329 [Gelatoporia subvermispora B]
MLPLLCAFCEHHILLYLMISTTHIFASGTSVGARMSIMNMCVPVGETQEDCACFELNRASHYATFAIRYHNDGLGSPVVNSVRLRWVFISNFDWAESQKLMIEQQAPPKDTYSLRAYIILKIPPAMAYSATHFPAHIPIYRGGYLGNNDAPQARERAALHGHAPRNRDRQLTTE